MKSGNDITGTNNPHRKIIGKRKKFEYVCASNTSFAETEISNPSKVDMIDKRIIPTVSIVQLITVALKYNTENKIGTMLLKIPNSIAPVIFAIISNLILIGANNKRSNDLDFLSNVIVTASIEVVPKRIDMPTIPGKTSLMLKVVLVFMNIINIQAKGKIIPQLIFGGFR